MSILFQNITVLPMTADDNSLRYFIGYVGIKGEKIDLVSDKWSDAEQFMTENPDAEIFDGDGKVIMPGLINLHTHASMTLMRGYANDMTLMTWLKEYIWPLEAQMDATDVAVGARLAIAEMLLGGTTTFVDMYWYEDTVADVIKETGIRGAAGNVFMTGRNGFKQVHETLVCWYGRGQCSRVMPMVAPHAPYTVNGEDLVSCRDLSRDCGMRMQLHLSETTVEVANSKMAHGMSPVEYLDSLGVLNNRCIAAHCVHVDDTDIAILQRRSVSVAHNPQSNMMLGSGIAPVARMLRAGINVGLGTDGASSNNDLDMWEEMRTAALLSKVFPQDDDGTLSAYDVLKMATVAGAKALGMENELGKLKAGMLADIIVLDMKKPHLAPTYDVISNIVYCAKSSDVNMVVVNGVVLVRDGRLLALDYGQCITDAQDAVERLLDRVGKYGKKA